MKLDKSFVLTLVGLFLILEITIYFGHVTLSLLEWIWLALAASLIGRAVAYMTIGYPFRALFATTKDHPNGIGGWTEPKYDRGWKKAIGELLTCPVCSGTWAAALLLILWNINPTVALHTCQVFAAGSVAALVSYTTEAIEWAKANSWEQACYYRKRCIEPQKQQDPTEDIDE